ncbi:MAG TPA: type IV pilus assembly protein PilM [Acidimicrobiales bacterium]|nr:type IV pilus assembly protein PilM [Acidimicrobiales bacterium]
MPKRTTIGLDIGSSAVRAAQVTSDGKRAEVDRFAQVGLPPGAVVEGEIRDHSAVVTALRRLWSDGGFGQKSVVLGVSSQRAMVRMIEMPAIEDKQVRSALRYEIGDLLPIPVDDAVFDFAIVGPGRPKGDGGQTTQVLVVAAQKDIVSDEVAVATKAGLRVAAVDASPLALLRAVPSGGASDGLDAVVSVGAQLLVVAVRQGGVPRFLRTTTLASDVVAEPVARVAAGAKPGSSPAGTEPRTGPSRTDLVVEEVRSSIEYFLSHAQGSHLTQIELTGGGALVPGLVDRLSSGLALPVVNATAGVKADGSALGLTEEQLAEASQRWVTAVGLGLWGSNGSYAVSLLPPEIAERARQKRTIALAAAGVVVVAGGLGVLSHGRVSDTTKVTQQAVTAGQQVSALDAEIARLGSLTLVQNEVSDRRALAASSLATDADWLSLYSRINQALPPGVKIQTISFSSDSPSAAVSGASPSTYIGAVSITVQAKGGLPVVADFVKAESAVKGMTGLWIGSTSSLNGVENFAASADITAVSESNRASKLPGGPQ